MGGEIEVVDEAVAQFLRQKTPAERIALAPAAAHRMAQALIAAGVPLAVSDWTDRRRCTARSCGDWPVEQIDLLKHAIDALEKLEIPYMLVGSIASTVYGEPRFTQDIDIVLELPVAQIPAFCAARCL